LAIFANIFVENARLFQLFKHLKKAAKGIYKMTQMQNKRGNFFIDSTPLPVRKNVHHATHRTLRGMAQWVYSSVSIIFGLKINIVAMKDQKIVRFTVKRGNLYDVMCADELLYER
jgi:hypothetical protein